MDTQCGLSSSFEDLVSQGRARPFEIEHIWADHYDRFKECFPNPTDFETERNHLGGLLLLQRGVNQSIGDATYENKRDAYVSNSENLLARSLHPLAYENLPSFRSLRDRTGLPFRAYNLFGPEQQAERQELYIDAPEAAENKALFDALHAERLAIEADFGGALSWQRLNDKRASRISVAVPGGWADDQTWPSAIEQTVSAMQRLYRALSPRVAAARTPSA